jgi:hypothetical protein
LAGARELDAFAARGHELNVQVVPQWALQNESRLAARPASRRYVWGHQSAEPDVPCPNDSLYWRSALLDRADEFLGGRPGLTAVALDLELYRGHRHRYDAGPCRCDSCLAEFYAGRTPSDRAAPSDPDLMGWEESHLQRVLTGILREFAARHPGIEIAVFDLDFSSFVHRALGRALAASGVPTSDYCEASYAAAGDALPAARAALDALGLQRAPLIGGLWLKCFAPRAIGGAVRSVETKAQGLSSSHVQSVAQPAASPGSLHLARQSGGILERHRRGQSAMSATAPFGNGVADRRTGEQPPIRMLHVITRLVPGGADENTLYTVKGLDPRRYRVDLAVGEGSDAALLEGLGPVNVHRIAGLVRDPHPLHDLRALIGLARLMRKHRYQIVHTHTAKGGFLGRLAAALVGTPIIVHTVHGVTFHDHLPRLQRMFYLALERIAGRFTHQFVTVGEDVRRIYVREGIGEPQAYETIYSGMPLDDYLDAGEMAEPERQAIRAELGLEPHHQAVAMAARPAARKGHGYLLEAVHHLKPAHPDLRVLILGDGPLRESSKRGRARSRSTTWCDSSGTAWTWRACSRRSTCPCSPRCGRDCRACSCSRRPRASRSSPSTSKARGRWCATARTASSCPPATWPASARGSTRCCVTAPWRGGWDAPAASG